MPQAGSYGRGCEVGWSHAHSLHNAPLVLSVEAKHPFHPEDLTPRRRGRGFAPAAARSVGILWLRWWELVLPEHVTQPGLDRRAVHASRDLERDGAHARVDVAVRAVRVLERPDRLVRHGEGPNVEHKREVDVRADLRRLGMSMSASHLKPPPQQPSHRRESVEQLPLHAHNFGNQGELNNNRAKLTKRGKGIRLG